MKYFRTADGYAEYLKSEHWRRLRARVLERDGRRCVRCRSRWRLQAHHKFYRDDWEDAVPEDLETLCKPCHDREHPEKHPSVKVTVAVEAIPLVNQKKALDQDRSTRSIGRREYLIRRQQLVDSGEWIPLKRQRVRRKKRPRKRPQNQNQNSSCKPWFYSPRRMHWVNRGTSSN